ncbi:hypothetical protein GLYMA_13G235451v4 [Glycine max]|nr:hypothetical protein GLYMA_13G235451v4 [Glycine max]KAH1103012.1 hypothetical protein GYH30_037159 [Glycine max]
MPSLLSSPVLIPLVLPPPLLSTILLSLLHPVSLHCYYHHHHNYHCCNSPLANFKEC